MREIVDYFSSQTRFVETVGLSLGETIRTLLRGRENPSPALLTAIGPLLETILLERLEIPQQHTGPDAIVMGAPMDIKHTIGDTWMIGPEYIGVTCLLIKTNLGDNTFSVGFLQIQQSHLTSSQNRDTKHKISAAGRKSITWLAQGLVIPTPLEEVSESRFDRIEKSISRLTERVEEALTR